MRNSWRARALVATAAVAILLLSPTAARAAARAGSIALVDVAPDGTIGDGYIGGYDMSDDGRYVAFESSSSNLAPGDNGGQYNYNIFVRDLRTGTTTRVTTGIDGQPPDNYSEEPVISGNGRYVAFTSWASNLVPGDTNGERDVFVYDRQTRVTTRASVATGNVQLNGIQSGPSISDNGRYVTFIETDFGNGNGQLAYLHDMKTGTTRRITTPSGGDPDQAVFQAFLSGNGKHLVFSADGSFTGEGGVGSAIYLEDVATGTATRISPLTVGGVEVSSSFQPSIDRAGTRVVYSTTAGIDPSDTNQATDLYAYDVATGVTSLVSQNRAGTAAGNTETMDGKLSADGRFVAFFSTASDLVAHDTNGDVNDVFLRDLRTGRTTLVTASPAGGSGNNLSWSGIPSADGSRVVFDSVATNLGVDPGDGGDHIFARCLRAC